MNQEEQLERFYRDYLKWVEDGAIVFENGANQFTRGVGLCTNLCSWCGKNRPLYRELESLMRAQFAQAGLDMETPFNKDLLDYQWEGEKQMHHLNPLRIKWVQLHTTD